MQSYPTFQQQPTHKWEWFNGHLPHNTVYTDPSYAVIRAEYSGDWVIGKYSVQGHKPYIPWGGKEVEFPGSFEVLTHAPGTNVRWVPASYGQVVGGAIGPVGKEGLFVGRAVCPQPESKYTPGKVHPTHQCIYIPWGGQEHKIQQYEVCVIESAFNQGFPQQPQMNVTYNPQMASFPQQPQMNVTFGQPQPQQMNFGVQVQPQYPTQQMQQMTVTSYPSQQVSHKWEWFNGAIPQSAVFTDPSYCVIRAEHSGDWVIGKYCLTSRKAYVPWGGQEVELHTGFEVLTHAPGTNVKWVPASYGQVVGGAIGPVGKDQLYVGRAVCPQPENKYTPGKIHPAHQCIYIPWGGKEHKIQQYEVCVIEPGFGQGGFIQQGPTFTQPNVIQTVTFNQQPSGPLFHWEKFGGHHLPQNAVHADPAYVVIRAHHSGDWIIGKFSTQGHKAYIPWGGKEIEVHHGVEILVHAPGTSVHWVPASHGSVPQGAVGPVGNDQLYVGRAVCPHPENKYTPGKIHPAHRKLYIPWGGQEHGYDNYEALTIKYGGW